MPFILAFDRLRNCRNSKFESVHCNNEILEKTLASLAVFVLIGVLFVVLKILHAR